MIFCIEVKLLHNSDDEHPNRKMKFIGLTIATAISLRYWGLKRTLCEHKFSQQAEMSILMKRNRLNNNAFRRSEKKNPKISQE